MEEQVLEEKEMEYAEENETEEAEEDEEVLDVEPYPLHELAELFPKMSDEEYESLKTSIYNNGLIDPITVWEEQVIDGSHRQRACFEIGIVPEYIEYDFDYEEARQYVIDKNMLRRHLTVGQRALMANKLARLTPGGYRDSVNSRNESMTQAEAAKTTNVGTKAVEDARKLEKNAVQPVIDLVDEGEVSLHDAVTISKEEPDVQEAAAERVRSGESDKLADAVRAEKSSRNVQRKQELAENPPELPEGQYNVVVIDPPWQMDKITRDERPNQIDMDYPTMTLDEIAEIDIESVLADDSWVFMWTTQKNFFNALNILDGWELECVSWWFTWVKKTSLPPLFESPQWNCEYVVAAKLGKPEFVTKKGLKLGFFAENTEHSRKPEEFYEMIRNSTYGKRLDMFGRRGIEGFDSWGNESDGPEEQVDDNA